TTTAGVMRVTSHGFSSWTRADGIRSSHVVQILPLPDGRSLFVGTRLWCHLFRGVRLDCFRPRLSEGEMDAAWGTRLVARRGDEREDRDLARSGGSAGDGRSPPRS